MEAAPLPPRFREAFARPVCAKTSAPRLEALVAEIIARGEDRRDRAHEDDGESDDDDDSAGAQRGKARRRPDVEVLFDEKERKRLGKVTGLGPEELADVVELGVQMLERIGALETLDSAQLVSLLASEQGGMDFEHAQAFSRAWSLHASRQPIAQDTQQHAGLGHSERAAENEAVAGHDWDAKVPARKLKRVNWDVSLHLANTNAFRLAIPTASLHLEHKSGASREQTSLSFTRTELYALFKQLEAIQGDLEGGSGPVDAIGDETEQVK